MHLIHKTILETHVAPPAYMKFKTITLSNHKNLSTKFNTRMVYLYSSQKRRKFYKTVKLGTYVATYVQSFAGLSIL